MSMTDRVKFSPKFLVAVVLACLLSAGGAHARTVRLFSGLASVNIPPGTRVKNLGAEGYAFLRPVVQDFSPNVNVMAQSYSGGIRAYAALSKRQFKSLGFKVLYSRFFPSSGVWDVEYRGIIGVRLLHFYARSFKVSGGVVLWTATNLDSQWESTSTDTLIDMLSSARVR